jgi:hypothetical protein
MIGPIGRIGPIPVIQFEISRPNLVRRHLLIVAHE